MAETAQEKIDIAIDQFGERYAGLRIINPKADKAMIRSLEKYGQLTPVVVSRSGAAVKRRMNMNFLMVLSGFGEVLRCPFPISVPVSWS